MPAPAPSALVGRDRELAILREKLAITLAGNGGLVLIGGEAGIGKTALAEMFCREAEQRGVLVLVGRSYDLTETPPYGPWVELSARYQPNDDDPPLPNAFARRGTIGTVTSQAALFQQVLDFFVALAAQHPLILLLDDAHWMDAASLDLLRFLARELMPHRIVLLVTYRVDDLTRRHLLSQLLPLLVRESSATRLDLHALQSEHTAALVRARFVLTETDAARLVGYLDERAEGNPFFVGELLRTLEEAGVLRQREGAWTLIALNGMQVPPLLRQVIDRRLARLSDEAQALLAVAAVIGHEVPLAVWAAVADSDEEAVSEIVERGIEARLLTEVAGDEGIRFAHALIREALYERLPGVRRRRIHRRAGEALADTHRSNADAVASHFQRAGDARALPWLLEAGERAQAAYAWATAAARFEAALALMEQQGADAGERGWLLLRSSRLLRYVEMARARTCADAAYALSQAADDGALAAFARFQRGILACHVGDVAYGLPEMEAGSAALVALSDAERAHLAAHAAGLGVTSRLPDGLGTVVAWRANVGRYRAAREMGERLVAEAVPGVSDGYFGLGDTYAALGMPDEAAAMHAQAHEAYAALGHHAFASLVLQRAGELVTLPFRAEHISDRQRLAERAEAEWARASGAVPPTIPPRFMRLPLLVLEGQWEEGERLAAAVSAEEPGNSRYGTMALRYRAALARLRGDTEGAHRAVYAVLPAGSATDPGTVAPFDVAVAVQEVAAALALDADDLLCANAWLDAHDRWLAWSEAVRGLSEGQALWARYHRQAGDTDAARSHAERALAFATEPRQPLALLAAHRLLGELATDAGHFDDALTHLDAALRLADACAAPYERALTLLARAELLAATSDRAGATVLLEKIRALCTPLRATPALARADTLATRLAAPPSSPPTDLAGLTGREAEVLRLVARGLTDVQVAEQLFLSSRTIQGHLRSIYSKLGVASRSAATRYAFEHHLM